MNHIKEICSAFQLGELISPPKLLPATLHQIWQVETNLDLFAIKIFNSEILTLQHFDQNHLENGQKIAHAMSEIVPTVVAKLFQKNFVWTYQEHFFMVFPWVEGKCIQHVDTTKARLIGRYLGLMHSTSLQTDIPFPKPQYFSAQFWQELINDTKELKPYLSFLQPWSEQISLSDYQNLLGECVISHCDLDQKNVLWANKNPIFLDWDYAGWINPMLELFIVALNWSNVIEGSINLPIFKAVIQGYETVRTISDFSESAILSGYCAYVMEWIVFNIKRAMTISDAKTIAFREVKNSFQALHYVMHQGHSLLINLKAPQK